MLLLDRQTGATAQPRTEANRPNLSTGRVQLRLRADGQVLELPAGKTTIGSSPRCNVRIEQPGVQPLHCLIVEGPEGLRVRSWVANTTLNGVPFEESALAVGDCLSLGQVEIEVIDPQAGQAQVVAEAPVVESKDAEQIRAGRDRARIRSRRLLDALRQQRSSHHELCQQGLKLQESHLDAIAEQNEISGKLESCLSELAAARRQLGDFQSVETARQQLATQNEQLGFEIGELSAQINELQQSQTEAVSDRQKLAADCAAFDEQHRQLSEVNTRLQSELGQVANEKNAIGEQHRQLIEANARLQIELGQLTNEKRATDEQCWKLADEKSHLQNEFNRLADEKNALGDEHRQQIEANSSLQCEIGQLANEKAAADEHGRQLEGQKGQLQDEFDRLADEKNSLGEQYRQLTDANAGLQGDLHRIASEKATADEQCRQLTEQKSQLQGEFNLLANEKNSLGEQYRQLTEANAGLQGEVHQLVSEKAVADEQCRQLAEQKSELQSDFDRLANEKNSLNDEHRQLGEVNSRLQSDVVQLANEKAAADEQSRELAQQKSQLQNAVAHLAEQKEELEAEREGLRRQNEQLLHEARELAGERSSMADERTSLCQERSELRHQNESLRARITQLNDENSAMAVGKLTLIDQRDTLDREVTELRVRVAKLGEENTSLATAKATLAEEQARLIAEKNRLAEIEREMGAAVAGREDTSAELYRALLQLAEMQERDEQSKAVIEAYESLSKEHDHLHEESDQLKSQIERLSEERATVENAWHALSAEAETLGESQQRTADENAALVARLDEMQLQLEQSQQEQATLASTAAEVERERAAKLQAENDVAAAKLQAEANVAAAIADGERRLEEQERRFAEQAQQFAAQSSQFNERLHQQAEHSRDFAESIRTLERQLAAAGEMRDSLAQAREEAQLQLADAESRRAEQSRRIQTLESELAAAESRAATAAELAASAAKVQQTESVSPVATEQPAEFRWSSARAESAADEELKSVDESPADAVAWDRPASVADAWPAAAAEVPTNEVLVERTSDAWLNPEVSEAVADEPNPWDKTAKPQAAIDASTFGEDDGASLVQQPVDEAASIEPSSTLEQVAEQPEIVFAAPVFAKPEEPKLEVKAKPEPVSLIERYSHLLEEDGAVGAVKPERPNPLAQALPLAPAVARPEEAILAPKKSEEEDSIEQYMAKLLQRVRGDSDGGKTAREQPSRMPLNAPAAKPAPTATTAPENRLEGDTNGSDAQPADSGELVKRRVFSPTPATNLGALRALANETARLAISRHELRKLRRNAVTKVIVSTLAGVTSLWLMLDSEDWRTMQFVTACAALMVAVYWAGETFRTLINSMRVKPFEGADAEETALPIDVESDEKR